MFREKNYYKVAQELDQSFQFYNNLLLVANVIIKSTRINGFVEIRRNQNYNNIHSRLSYLDQFLTITFRIDSKTPGDFKWDAEEP